MRVVTHDGQLRPPVPLRRKAELALVDELIAELAAMQGLSSAGDAGEPGPHEPALSGPPPRAHESAEPADLLVALLLRAAELLGITGHERLVVAVGLGPTHDQRVGFVSALKDPSSLAPLVKRGERWLVDVRRPSAGHPSPAETLMRAGAPLHPLAACNALGDALAAMGVRASLETSAYVGLAPERLSRATNVLFERSLEPKAPALGWDLLRAAAVGLARQTNLSSDARRRISFARDVARRHLGDSVLLDWPDEQSLSLSRDQRLQWAAHAVQSAADANLSYVDEYIEESEALVPLLESRAPLELHLEGARGRARAAVGDFHGAARLLRHATLRWLETTTPELRSWPLSEWLRVSSLATTTSGALDESLHHASAFIHETSDCHISKCFVAAAAARALSQVGAHHDALMWLDQLPEDAWLEAPPHVRAARLRTRWRAASALADARAAEVARNDLERLGEPWALSLVELEAATRDDRVDVPLLSALLDLPGMGGEALRTLDRLGARDALRASPAQVRALCDQFRY